MGYTLIIYGFAFLSVCLMIWSDSIVEDYRAARLMDIIGYVFALLFVVSAGIQISIHFFRI